MGYTSLYRRYRSQDFDELVGQPHIRATLQHALQADRLAPAYLFAGPRGTGKTSTARILAKAINCETGPTPNPCNRCAACLDMTAGTCLDVIELDAASHTGVDDIREVIVTKVHFPPTQVRRKVYIIDEVHKLSNSAFNALLKTLEEPPAHVVFVLATTDPQNVPATILSRCQRFEFHRIDHRDMLQHLRNICQCEGMVAEEGALHAIAEAADGALRDALVILEQVAAQGEVLEGTVLATLGLTPYQALARLTDLLQTGQAGAAIQLLHELQGQGKDPVQLARDALQWWRRLLLYKVSNDAGAWLSVPSSLQERLRAQAEVLTTERAYRLVRLALGLLDDMREATWVTILWEAALVRMAHPELDDTREALAARVAILEQQLAGRPPVAVQPAPASNPVAPPLPAEAPRGATPPAPAPKVAVAPSPAPAADEMPLPDLWKRLLSVVQRRESGPLNSFLAEARPLSAEGDTLTISLGQGKAFEKERIEKRREVVEQAAQEVAGRVMHLKVVLEGQAAPPAAEVHDSFVKNTIELFGGHIIEP